MNKLIKISLATAMLIGANLHASEAALLNEISTLKAEMEKLKKSVDGDIEELHERADSNEFEATMNRIKWGGGLEVEAQSYEGTQGSMTTPMGVMPGTNYNNANKWSTKLKLTMEAKINDNTKFTGRLAMYKGWADSTPHMMLGGVNEGKTVNSGTSTLFVERAYIDYKMTNFLTMTIGRQPSTDGPGMSLRQNTPRQATYPSILFDGNSDGIIFTANAGKLEGVLDDTKFRVAYGKGFQKDDAMHGFMASDNDVDDLDVLGLFAETSIHAPSMGENLIVFSYVNATGFVNTGFNDRNLGDFDLAGVYFENNKAFGTNLSYFVSYGYSKGSSNGKTFTMNGQASSPTNPPLSLIDDSGSAYHVGMRYDFDAGFKLGYEFNHGDKNWFSFTQGSEDPMNKLATRGSVHDMYAIYQVDRNQFIRAGYTDIDYDYINSGYHFGMGQAVKTDDEAKRAYLLYNVKF